MSNWIPIFMFSLNGVFTHAFTMDRTFETSQECHEVVDKAVLSLQESGKAPPGAAVTGGCIGLPLSMKVAPPAPPAAKPDPKDEL